jgi:hypothetical protein
MQAQSMLLPACPKAAAPEVETGLPWLFCQPARQAGRQAGRQHNRPAIDQLLPPTVASITLASPLWLPVATHPLNMHCSKV